MFFKTKKLKIQVIFGKMSPIKNSKCNHVLLSKAEKIREHLQVKVNWLCLFLMSLS